MQKYSSNMTEYLTAEKSEKGQILSSQVPLESKSVMSKHVFVLLNCQISYHITYI